MVTGMAMIINEAPERHPPLPVGFPTCGNYDIGAAGYKESIDTAKHPKSGIPALSSSNAYSHKAPSNTHSYIVVLITVINCIYILISIVQKYLHLTMMLILLTQLPTMHRLGGFRHLHIRTKLTNSQSP